MTRIADLVSTGFFPLRHHDSKFDLPLRVVMYAARIGGTDLGFGSGFDDLGILQGETRLNGNEDTHGDILGAGLWQFDPNVSDNRGIPGWNWAWASVVNDPNSGRTITGSPSGNAGAPVTNGLPAFFSKLAPDDLPVTVVPGVSTPQGMPKSPVVVLPARDNNWTPDKRFKTKLAGLPDYADPLPLGVAGITLTATKETSQEDVFIPTGVGPIVAPYFGGDPVLGTTVWDLKDTGQLDYRHRAKLQSMMRVWSVPEHGSWLIDPRVAEEVFGGPAPNKGLAFQLGGARAGISGRGVMSDDEVVGQSFNTTVGSFQNVQVLGIKGTSLDPALNPNSAADIAREFASGLIKAGTILDATLTISQSYSKLVQDNTNLKTQENSPKPSSKTRTQVLAAASRRAFGPLLVGSSRDVHKIGFTPDGESLNSLHLWTNSLFSMDDDFHDAPLAFTTNPFAAKKGDGPNVEVELVYDSGTPHDWFGEPKPGKWRWQVPIPFYKTRIQTGQIDTGVTTGPITTGPVDTGPVGTGPVTTGDIPTGTITTGEIPTGVVPTGDIPTGAVPTGGIGTGAVPTGPIVTSGVVPTGPVTPPTPPNGGNDQNDGGPVVNNTNPGRNSIFTPSAGDIARKKAAAAKKRRSIFNPGDANDGTTTVIQDAGTGLEPYYTAQAFSGDPISQPFRNYNGPQSSLATLSSVTVPQVNFRAQNFDKGANDHRAGDWNANDALAADTFNPVVATFTAVANQTSTSFNYFNQPGSPSGIYGPTSNGTVSFGPANTDVTQIMDGTAPTSTPTTNFNLYNANMTWGTPMSNGGVGSGVSMFLSGGNLVAQTLNSTGGVTGTYTVVPPTGGSGGLVTGPLSGLPGTPSSVGQTYVCTDKFNDGSSGGADATNFFNVGILDALTWAKIALANFPQTISSNWTLSGGNIVTGSLAWSGSGTVDANKLLGKTIGAVSTNNALIYNGSSLVFATLGVAGGGTGLTSLTANAIYYANSTTSFASFGAPDTRGGQIVSSTTNPIWSYNITGGTQTGTNIAGSDRNIEGMVGTGTGVGGAIVLRAAPPGTTGTTANTLVNVASVTGRGSFLVNATGAKLAQAATDGFLYVPQVLTGPPTGNPTAITGGIALAVGSDNHLYFNPSGTSWVQVDPAAGGSNTLAQVLVAGNVTGGTNLRVTFGDAIKGIDGVASNGLDLWLQGGDGAGTNKTGGPVTISGGNSTGNGAGGSFGSQIFLQVAGFAASGTAVNTPETAFQIYGRQNYLALATVDIISTPITLQDFGTTSHATVQVCHLNPTINYTAATKNGSYEVLVVDPTATSEPTGTNYLAAFRKSGATKATIDTAGQVTATSFATTTSVFWSSGAGSPNGVVTASPGSLYTNTSGGANTTLYVKESGTGNTGWVAK